MGSGSLASAGIVSVALADGSAMKAAKTPMDATKSNPAARDARRYIPSGAFTRAILLGGLDAPTGGQSQRNPQPVLLRLAEDSLQAEAEHLLHSVERLLEGARERMQEQIKERMEAVDTFFEGLNLGEEEDSAPRGPRELLEELSGLVHLPVRLSNDEQRLLRDDPRQVKETVRTQVENGLINQALTRLLGSVERRLEEPLDLDVASLPSRDWKALSAHIFDLIQARLDKRRERLLGEESGSLVKDLESDLAKIEGAATPPLAHFVPAIEAAQRGAATAPA